MMARHADLLALPVSGAASRCLARASRSLFLLALCCTVLRPGLVRAHDTTLIIQRAEPRRLSLVLVFDPVQSLNQWLAPQLSLQAFLAAYSQKPSSEFKRELQPLQAAIERGVRLAGADGLDLVLSAWGWPTATQWQGWLRERMRQQLQAGPAMLLHSPTIEVHVQARSSRPLARLQLTLPKLMYPALVIHPPADQFWIGTLSPVAYLDP